MSSYGLVYNPAGLTPVEHRGDYWLKRDDLYDCNGARGGKSRTFLRMMHQAQMAGVRGVVTFASRVSPQQNYPALIAEYLGMRCRVHIPVGQFTPETDHAIAHGAEILCHKPGYQNNLERYSRDDASERGWLWIPFGLEGHDAIRYTAGQVESIGAMKPRDYDAVQRIVIPIGSGLSAAGILWGCERYGVYKPVVGVKIGKDPVKILDRWAPRDWRTRMTLVTALQEYHVAASDPFVESVRLDSHYEAKALPFLLPGDLFWIVGIRPTEVE